MGPALPLEGPTSAAWREEALTRAQELEALAVWIATTSSEKNNPAEEFSERIARHLEAARATAGGSKNQRTGGDERGTNSAGDSQGRLKRWLSLWGGSYFQRTMGNLDAVEAHLLRLAPADYVCGEMPSVAAYVCRYLKKDDPRRVRIEQLAAVAETRELTTAEPADELGSNSVGPDRQRFVTAEMTGGTQAKDAGPKTC